MAARITLPSIRDFHNCPRYASRNVVNGYPPPGQQQPQYLPPLQPQTDPRSLAYAPLDPRGGYYYDCWGQLPQGSLPPNVYEYPLRGAGAAPQLTQAAPRQRASIACQYCRRRKIRCSGYESSLRGKCHNCVRTNQECVFQPVSSSSSTAFIPVSAIPGGVPPGTQLVGAYGQPLAPSLQQTQHRSLLELGGKVLVPNDRQDIQQGDPSVMSIGNLIR